MQQAGEGKPHDADRIIKGVGLKMNLSNLKTYFLIVHGSVDSDEIFFDVINFVKQGPDDNSASFRGNSSRLLKEGNKFWARKSHRLVEKNNGPYLTDISEQTFQTTEIG